MRTHGAWRVYAVACLLCASLSVSGKDKTVSAGLDANTLLTQPDQIPRWLSEGRLRPEQVPDPHWRNDACASCHTRTPTAGNTALRHQGTETLCNVCHTSVGRHAYRHPSNLTPSADMRKRMPGNYRKAMRRDRIVCTTCHELPAQCLRERRGEQRGNRAFLRDGPFKHRSDPCYLCHDASAYARLNPHDQLDDGGRIRKGSCALCHGNDASLQPSTRAGEVGYSIRRDLASLCTGCHPWIPHPGGKFMFADSFRDRKHPEHLAVPPAPMRQRMREMAKKNGIILPLDPTTGKVYCATCHNPHERGLLTDTAASRGADADKRLRMQDLCTNCHDK